MTLYHVEIVSSALHNNSTGWRFKVAQAQLGAAIAAVLDVPRWITCWVGPTTTTDAEMFSEELLRRIKEALAGPFVELAKTSAEDPTGRAHALSGAEMIVARVGDEVREAAGAVEVYLPGRDDPEVRLVYGSAPGLN